MDQQPQSSGASLSTSTSPTALPYSSHSTLSPLEQARIQEWKDYKSFLEESFQRYASKTSDLVRQLALAGIAVVWVLRNASGSTPQLLPELRWAAGLLMLTLAIDLAHYVIGTMAAESRLDDIGQQEREALQNGKTWPTDAWRLPPSFPQARMQIMFWGKLGTLAVSYAILLVYMAFRM